MIIPLYSQSVPCERQIKCTPTLVLRSAEYRFLQLDIFIVANLDLICNFHLFHRYGRIDQTRSSFTMLGSRNTLLTHSHNIFPGKGLGFFSVSFPRSHLKWPYEVEIDLFSSSWRVPSQCLDSHQGTSTDISVYRPGIFLFRASPQTSSSPPPHEWAATTIRWPRSKITPDRGAGL